MTAEETKLCQIRIAQALVPFFIPGGTGHDSTALDRAVIAVMNAIGSPSSSEPAVPAWVQDVVIEYQYSGGTHWCPLGPAERAKVDFDGVYRLKPGTIPTESSTPVVPPLLSDEQVARFFGRLPENVNKYEARLVREIEQAVRAQFLTTPSQPSKYGSPELQALIVAHATQSQEQEPVAEVTGNVENHGRVTNELFWYHKDPLPVGTNLYTVAPSQPVPFDQWNSSPYTQVLHETIKDLSQKLASMTQSQPVTLTDDLRQRLEVALGQIRYLQKDQAEKAAIIAALREKGSRE